MADFATVTELEGFMGTPGLGSRGTAMLGYASAEIRRYTGQDIEETLGRQEEFAGGWGRWIVTLTQKPVTAVSAITVDAVAFTEFEWTRWGNIHRSDGLTWETGPIVVTYDSGYAAGSDELASVQLVCLEVAARALAGPDPRETFGMEIPEARGYAPSVFLTPGEMQRLDGLSMVGVG